MDRADVNPDDLGHSLDDLKQVNRWLGGNRSAVRLVLGLARRVPGQPVRVLDVATGGADIPRLLASQARSAGVPMKIIATDFHPETLAYAARETAADPDIEIRAADAMDLPFEDGSIDIAMCCTALHHFSFPEAVQVLKELDRVSRHGIVVTDLARSRTAELGAQLLAATFWRNHPVTRHDGPASVRAAFTPPELAVIAAEAGLTRARVRDAPVFRVALVAGPLAEQRP